MIIKLILMKQLKLWDRWMEVGGNTFDNAYVYGQGSMEKLFR